MTRDEYREVCIKAMCTAMNKICDDPMCSQPKDEAWIDEATTAFDALHGIAYVVPMEATTEMCKACDDFDINVAMEVGDLTDPPGKK